jgi:hypothetical protein
MRITLPNLPKKQAAQIIAAGLLLSVATVSVYPLYAQGAETAPIVQQENQSSLTAVPTRLGDDNSIRLKPGEKKQVEVRVINSSSNTITIATDAQDFIVDEDGSTPIPLDNTDDKNNRWSLASWLVIAPNEQTVAPRRTALVNVLIEVPEDALPGGHYAMITHQPTLSSFEETGSEAASGVNQRVGTLVYVVVEGPINEEAFVSDFTFPKFTEFGPVPYSFTVDNRSDIHISPQVGINIKNMFGQTVDTIQTDSKNIFPLTSRKYEGAWKRIWGFGPYTAELTMSFGTQGKVVIAYSRFWLLPIKIVLAILVVLLTAIAAGISIRRHILHKKQDQTQRISELETKLQQLEKDKLKKYEE